MRSGASEDRASTERLSTEAIFASQGRMAELTGVANAATAAVCAEIASALVGDGWYDPYGSLRSPEHWVAWRTGCSPRRARRLVLIARRWHELPACRELFRQGRLGEDAMTLVARLLPAWRDDEVAEVAPLLLHSQLTKLCRAMADQPAPAPQREPSVQFGTDDDGGEFTLRANLDVDDGAVVTKGLEAARNHLFHLRRPDDASGEPAPGEVTWADALVHMAELSLLAVDPSASVGGRASDRFQVFVHVDTRQGAPVTALHLGPVVRDSLARYLTCDTTIAPVLWDAGELLGIFPNERTVNDRLRRVIEQRDQGCRVPGCTQQRWLHVHHLVYVEDGGLTIPTNLLCLCPFHHRLHHRGLLGISGDAERPDGLTFTDRFGNVLRAPGVPPPGTPPDRPPPRLGLGPAFTCPIGEPTRWSDWSFRDPLALE